MAQLMDGKALAAQIRQKLAQRVSQLNQIGVRPGLAVVLIGDNPASQVYVRNKVKACEDVGILSEEIRLPLETTQAELLSQIDTLNRRNDIHGILVQLPLPSHIDNRVVLEALHPSKDVDGFHPANLGRLMSGNSNFIPCTPLGIMCLLETYEIPLRGVKAVVVGASNIVGKPIGLLLLQAGATVTICNSKTPDISVHTSDADVVIAAVGKIDLINGDMLKPGACVIDVGINRNEAGKLVGDVDFDSASEVAGYITPVPGGVGPMTIAMLISNTVDAAQHYLNDS